EFDLEDIDAAFEELESRFLAGEAATHANVWSIIASSFAAFNRHELIAGEWITADHRKGSPFGPREINPSIRTIWDLTPDLAIHIETVHRLTNSGAVIAHNGRGTSQDGFAAEWRAIDLLIVEGDRITRCEIFDEDDVDAALARFDELSRPAPLENTASRKYALFMQSFAARDWDALAELLADNMSQDDRRRVVNSGIRSGRDLEIADMRALARLGVTEMTSEVIAVRGERLALCRIGSSVFKTGVLNVVEIDADGRIAAVVGLDLDDVDAAFAELDTRYLAGEAAAYAHTWSVIEGTRAAFNRHETPSMAPDLASVDHRRGIAFASGEFIPYLRSTLDVAPYIKLHIEVVHRLSNLGVVLTHGAYG